jgi:phage gp29-like protein
VAVSGQVRIPAYGKNAPGVILDSRGNPYRAPREPLGKGARDNAKRVIRDLTVSPIELEWDYAGVQSAIHEHAFGMFTRSAALIDAMAGHDRIQSSLGSRVDALLGLDEVYEASEHDTDGAVLAAWKEAWPACHAAPEAGDTLDVIRRGALMAGLSVSELVWDTEHESGLWMPYLKPWSLQHVWFDIGRRCLIANTEEGAEVIVPGDGKWFVHAPFGIFRGYLQGLVRALALPWLLHSLARRDWARYSERHGMPIFLAKMPAMSNAEDKKRFEDDLVTMGSEAVVTLPQGVDGEGFDLDLLEAASQSWEGFDRLIIRCESAITLAIQWQNLTTEIKEGSEAAARVHADVKQSAIVFDDRALGTDVDRQIARPFAAFNFGDPKRAPKTRRDVTVLEDQVAAMQALVSFANAVAALAAASVEVDVPVLAKAYRLRGLDKAKRIAAAVQSGAKPEDAVKEAA